MTRMTGKHLRVRSALLLMLLGPSLSGCGVLFGDDGYFRNREDDYLKADSLPPLDVPPHLNEEAPGTLYDIPALTEDDAAFVQDTDRYVVPRPRPLAANALVEQVKIQRLGEDRWILVNVQPGQVWPQVSNFLSTNELGVSRTNTDRGVLETGWVSFNDDDESVHRFRVRIDRGVQPDTSEIHILHMALPQSQVAADSPWPATSTSKDREHWLVGEMANNLAAENISDLGGTSMVAQSIGGEAKSDLRMIDGEPVLELRLNRQRALANLAHATQQDGLNVLDSKTGERVIYLAYQEPAEEPGWFGRLFGFDESEPEPSSPYNLDQLLDALPGSFPKVSSSAADEVESRLPGAPGYLMVLNFVGEDLVEARLRDPYGRTIAPRRARELLSIVRQNLI